MIATATVGKTISKMVSTEMPSSVLFVAMPIVAEDGTVEDVVTSVVGGVFEETVFVDVDDVVGGLRNSVAVVVVGVVKEIVFVDVDD